MSYYYFLHLHEHIFDLNKEGIFNMTYKMIVLDLDDTLLRDDHTISPRTKEALMTAQEQGVKLYLLLDVQRLVCAM